MGKFVFYEIVIQCERIMSKDFIFTILVIFIFNGAFFSYFLWFHEVPEIEEPVVLAPIKPQERVIEREEEENKPIEIAGELSVVADPSKYLPEGKNYAKLTRNAPIYSSAEMAMAGMYSIRQNSEIAWVNVVEELIIEGSKFYKVEWGWGRSGWITENNVSFEAILSRLKGIEIKERLDERLAMVYVDSLNVRLFPGDIGEDTAIGRLPKYSLLSVQEERVVNGNVWYKIAEDQWVHSTYVRNLTPGKRPANIGENDKWIEVNLSEQVIFAHEGDNPIYATLTSTGRYGHETITGVFWARVKTRAAPMQGQNFAYDFASVPWIYYFSGNYAWHGTYWHDNFGTVQSSGCVNLSPHDAHWFFHWSDPELLPNQREVSPFGGKGTWVYVHY